MHEVSKKADLTEKVAVVTGGNNGIGRAISQALAREGADIVLADIEPEGSSDIVSLVEAKGIRALYVQTDVSSKEQVESMIQQGIEQFGKIDILVNNAGHGNRGLLEEISEASWDRTMEINAKGNFLCIQAVYAHMKSRQYGKIINLSSVAGKIGGPLCKPGDSLEAKRGRSDAAYAASKGAIIALTKWVAKDAGQYGIYVNCIAPGPILTRATQDFDYGVENYPIPRMGKPEDIAEAVVFLASDASNYMTGCTLDINGGFYMS